MQNKALQRDLVINELTNSVGSSSNEFRFISADFGAKALDRLREEYPEKFSFVGIAEQFAIDFAYGLSSSGISPIVYGMSPFITLRCVEQIKVLFGQSDYPLLLISVGGGLGYDHSTLSHFSLEDIGMLDCIPGLEVITPSDCKSAVQYTKEWLDKPSKIYLRLERQALPEDISTIFKKEYKFFPYLLRDSSTVSIFSSPFLAFEHYQKSNDSIIIVESMIDLPRKIVDIINNASSVSLFEESYEFTGIYPWLSKELNGKNIKHYFVKGEIAKDRLRRSSIWEKYGLLSN
tara:strand:- start:612 stop:1481 length:870 start_codon:yes stop_codon:yes gene_type:complete